MRNETNHNTAVLMGLGASAGLTLLIIVGSRNLVVVQFEIRLHGLRHAITTAGR